MRSLVCAACGSGGCHRLSSKALLSSGSEHTDFALPPNDRNIGHSFSDVRLISNLCSRLVLIPSRVNMESKILASEILYVCSSEAVDFFFFLGPILAWPSATCCAVTEQSACKPMQALPGESCLSASHQK